MTTLEVRPVEPADVAEVIALVREVLGEFGIAFGVGASGARRIVLDTTEQMHSAIRFYERLGFVRDDAQITAPRCSRGYRLELGEPEAV